MATVLKKLFVLCFQTRSDKKFQTSLDHVWQIPLLAHSKELVMSFQTACRTPKFEKERGFHWLVSVPLAKIFKSFWWLPAGKNLSNLATAGRISLKINHYIQWNLRQRFITIHSFIDWTLAKITICFGLRRPTFTKILMFWLLFARYLDRSPRLAFLEATSLETIYWSSAKIMQTTWLSWYWRFWKSGEC